MKFNLDILGTKYKFMIEDGKINKYLRNNSSVGGYTDRIEKTIVVKSGFSEKHTKNIIIHELSHAFMNESGLTQYGTQGIPLHSEAMCEWLGTQYFKITECYEKIIRSMDKEKQKEKLKEEKKKKDKLDKMKEELKKEIKAELSKRKKSKKVNK